MPIIRTEGSSTWYSRPILIDLCKDGTISYREHAEQSYNRASLPVFSVNNVEEAKALQVHFGKLQYRVYPDMNLTWYRLVPFSGEVEDLEQVSMKFMNWYEENY